MSDVPSNLIPTRVTQLPVAPVASEDSLMMIVYQGNNYQIRVGDLLSVAGVPVTRQVIAGTGMSGGGQLTQNVTLSVAVGGIGPTQLADTGVSPGVYGNATNIPVFTVDAQGRVTAATTVPATGGGGVPTTREVIAGVGLNGGGPLSSNVTLNANLSDATPQAGFQAGSAGVSTDISRADHKHPAVDLSNDDEVDNILGLNNGGTARSLVANEGAIIWSGADGLYVGPAGVAGQVLLSGGIGQYTWADQAHLDVGQADNLNGGGANQLAYQTAADTTGFVPAPTLANTVLYWNGTDLIWGSVPGTGTVVSVGLALPSDFTVTGSPVTTSGTLTGAWAAQNPNLVLAGPASGGSPGTPSFRSLNNTDIPSALSGKTITGSTINSTPIGGTTPSSGVFTTVDATDVTASLVDATNLEVMNLKAKDGTAAGSIADTTGVVTLNSTVLTTTDINGGTIDNTVIGGTTPVAGSFTNISGQRIDLNTAPPAQTDQEGRMYWNSADNAKTLNIGMAGGAVVQQVGEELFYRVKASATISNGQVVMVTGSVGASGGLTAAPATGLAPTESDHIMGVATEDIANNAWGYVTYFGVVRGINTTGGAEAWTDGQILYYNPSVAGGLTKNKPSVPNAIVTVAAVIHAASNGSLFVRPTYGSVLGGSDGNVSFSTLNNGDVIVYDSAQQYWKNVAQSTLAVGTATNIAGGAAGSIPYQTGAGATSLLAAGTGVLVGGSTPSYSTTPTLTGTNFSGIPTGALSNSSVTIGSTSVSLGGTATTLAGLTSVTLTQDPSTALQAATKQYVDTLVSSGITYHAPVKYEVPDSTGNLNATYNNGTAGVGATLTNAGTLGAFTPDGVVASVSDRILIYNQTNQFENGVYTVTTVGDGSTAWVLTRATDANTYGLKSPNALGEGDAFFIQSGNTGAGETYVCNTSGTITFGTTAITFTQVSSSQVYSAGTGLTLTGTQFALSTPVSAANGGVGQSSYATGDMIYATGTTTLSKLSIGVSSRIMTSTGSAPTWTDPASITVGSATTATSATSATTATNIAGGAVGDMPYQTGAGATAFVSAGTADYVLKANGAAAPSWVAQSTLSVGSASSATSATTATNLAGGAASQIPYQSAAGTTTFLANGTAGQVLLSNGASAPSWGGIDGGTF